MNKTAHKILAVTLALGFVGPPKASAWGERGHDVVTRVAVRLLAAKIAKGTPLALQFGRKEFMLGHISNAPDIAWRNQGEAIEKVNAPTHFLDIEYVSPEVTFDTIPRILPDGVARMRQMCADKKAGYVCPVKGEANPNESSAGTAPWRVNQMYRRTVESFKAMNEGEKIDAAAVDRALLTAGLMSHFVGDLGNPYHATAEYDGWGNGEGGIHSYFESSVVLSYRLILDQEVFDAAMAGHAMVRVMKQIPAASRVELERDPIAIAVALALDSHSRLAEANRIDKTFAIIKPSGIGPDGKRFQAERRDASELRFKYHELHIERLATAAEVLANLWYMAWVDAGKPDFKGYQSFAYPLAPEFIPPDYLSPAK
ncbi:MAG: hypothetical protein ABI672_11350 [Vicinamibacteria bacterium]